MIINHIITTIELGGAEKQLVVLVKEQVKKGHIVSVTYLKGLPELQKNFESVGATVNSSIANLNFIMQIWKHIKIAKNQDGLYHAHLPRAEILCFLTVFNKQLVASRHNTEYFFPKAGKKISSILSRVVTSKFTNLIAISQSVTNFLHKNNEISKKSKISIVYYGFDKESINRSKSLLKKKSDKKNFRIGTISRLVPQKDIPTLIHGFKIFMKQQPNSILEIIGVGPLSNELKILTSKLSIEDKVIFYGKKTNPIQFIADWDLFVLTSKYEGFGLVLLEAMSQGIPIIAAKNSAIVEVLGEKYRYFFDTENREDLAQQMLEVKNNSDSKYFFKFFSERLNKFDPTSMSDKIESIYELNRRK